jgi:hypothetical protein
LLSIEATNANTKPTEYVLISNARIKKFPSNNAKHLYHELDDKTKKEINSLDEVKPRISFLDRVYFLTGPPLQEMSHILTSMIFEIVKDYGYDAVQGIKNDLLRHIGSMCPGRIDLEDMPTVYHHETAKLDLEHKSINAKIVKEILDSHRSNSTEQDSRKFVSNKLTLSYKIMPTPLNEETKQKIHEFLNEYSSLQDDDLRITYLQKFNDFSKRFDLYKDNEFLDFLEKQIKNSKNKHIVLECLFILHTLILTSKVEPDESFLAYVGEHYFSFLKERSELGVQTYEYSLFKIEQIFKEIENFISIEEICDMYWKRIVKIVEEKDQSGNRLGACIDAFNKNKCRLRADWRKWLNTKDEYSGIKNQILKEIPDSSIL